MCTIRGSGFGTSMPTAAFPGMGATMRRLGARIASARSSANAAIRPTFTPGPGATSYCVTTGPTVRPAMAPSTRKVWSVSMSLSPISSICASPASRSCAGGAFNRSRGGRRTPSGTGCGMRDARCMRSTRPFRSRGKRETGNVGDASADGWSRSTSLGFAGRSVSRFPFPVSGLLRTVRGCQPTVKIPSAESANSPNRIPPAVPTAACTALARVPGPSPASRWLAVHLA